LAVYTRLGRRDAQYTGIKKFRGIKVTVLYTIGWAC